MTAGTVIGTVYGEGDWGGVTVSVSCCDHMESHSFTIHTFFTFIAQLWKREQYNHYAKSFLKILCMLEVRQSMQNSAGDTCKWKDLEGFCRKHYNMCLLHGFVYQRTSGGSCLVCRASDERKVKEEKEAKAKLETSE